MRKSNPRYARLGRIAAFTGPDLNVEEMELASRTFADHGFRLALVSEDRNILKSKAGGGDLNFVVSNTLADLDVDDFVGLVLLDSARELPGGARSLVQQFMNQGKSVMALARSVGLLAEVTEAEIAEHSDVAMAINGTVYASSGRESSAQAVEIFADQLAA